jgi:hypothetical protein
MPGRNDGESPSCEFADERCRRDCRFYFGSRGFVFLSGFMAGCISVSAVLSKEPLKLVAWRLFSRASQLYLTYLVLLTMILGSIALGGVRLDAWRRLCSVGSNSLEKVWFYGAALLHQPAFLDIFSLYCLFLLLVPAMIAQIKAGRRFLIAT